MTDVIVIGGGALLIVIGLWAWVRGRPATVPIEEDQEVLTGVSIEPQPILSDVALSLFNLIKLAVEDRYLVFVQIPVWSLIAVNTADQSVRSRLLRKLALRRVDFALVHPGTRAAHKVVLLDGQGGTAEARRRRDQLIGSVLKMAGIDVVWLNAGLTYSVAALAEALGLEPPDGDAGG